MKWTNLERGVVSVLVFTDGSFIIEVLNYDFEFLDVEVRGTLDAKGRFSVIDANGFLWRGSVSASGGTVKGTTSDGTGKYTFSCWRRYRAAHDPAQ